MDVVMVVGSDGEMTEGTTKHNTYLDTFFFSPFELSVFVFDPLLSLAIIAM